MKDKVTLLVRKIADDDDQTAFREFFLHFYPRLLNLAYYYLESYESSKEIVSTVFIGLWNNRKKLPGIEKLDSYIFNSVKYKSLNYIRDNHKIHYRELNDDNDHIMMPMIRTPETEYLDKELNEKLVQAIQNLPPRCKMVYLLVRDEGLKYREVADLLEISVRTVEVQMSRALNKIKKEIKPYLEDPAIISSRQGS